MKKTKSQRKYSDTLKREVGRRYLRGEFSYAIAAEEYGLKDKGVAREFVKWYKMQREKPGMSESEVCDQEEKAVQASPIESLSEESRLIKELEKALRYAQLKCEGLETLLDIAKRDLGLDIRKKYGAKR